MRYLVMVTGQRQQEFTDVDAAMDYATSLVYLTPSGREEARKRLNHGESVNYAYGFNDVVITSWSEQEGGGR